MGSGYFGVERSGRASISVEVFVVDLKTDGREKQPRRTKQKSPSSDTSRRACSKERRARASLAARRDDHLFDSHPSLDG